MDHSTYDKILRCAFVQIHNIFYSIRFENVTEKSMLDIPIVFMLLVLKFFPSVKKVS